MAQDVKGFVDIIDIVDNIDVFIIGIDKQRTAWEIELTVHVRYHQRPILAPLKECPNTVHAHRVIKPRPKRSTLGYDIPPIRADKSEVDPSKTFPLCSFSFYRTIVAQRAELSYLASSCRIKGGASVAFVVGDPQC